MYNGPGAHIITYPVGMDTILNVLAVLSDPNPWHTADGKHTAKGQKKEAVDAFASWGPTVRAIVDLLPEEMDKWAVFDMKDRPAPFYSNGKICVAGDAAHTVGPHLGAGGGLGIEDALALSTLFETVQAKAVGKSKEDRDNLIREALLVYNDLRYERTQSVVKSTRVACDLFQWKDARYGKDPEKFGPQITEMFQSIWNYDIDLMVREGASKLDSLQ